MCGTKRLYRTFSVRFRLLTPVLRHPRAGNSPSDYPRPSIVPSTNLSLPTAQTSRLLSVRYRSSVCPSRCARVYFPVNPSFSRQWIQRVGRGSLWLGHPVHLRFKSSFLMINRRILRGRPHTVHILNLTRSRGRPISNTYRFQL